jgi:GT2 family glycosyltransferase
MIYKEEVVMGYEQVITLPERTIGRSGMDLFLSHKDVTIIMVPYERYSTFPKAVDDLYRSVQTPFNLIVVEGNAPESVRLQLEKRQQQHGNMTILYTNHCPGLANAFNLALPHFKTSYALFIDNEIRLPKGTLEMLVEAAQNSEDQAVFCPQDSLISRHVFASSHRDREIERDETTFGLKPCFLMSHENVRAMGKLFDENASPYTLGLDLVYKLRAQGLGVKEVMGAKIETRSESGVASSDFPLFRTQWNRERLVQSFGQLEKRWGIRLADDAVYGAWLQQKIQKSEKALGFEARMNPMISTWRESGWKRVQDTVVHLCSFASSKNSYPSKVNVSR